MPSWGVLARMVVTAVLLALLGAFCVAVWVWDASERSSVTLGLRGPSTVLSVQGMAGPRESSADREELARYLDDAGLPLLINNVGEGGPWAVALGPADRVPWLAAPIPPRAVLLVKGSYSWERWRSRRTLPGFVFAGATVQGTVAGLPDAANVDVVVGGSQELRDGDYVVGTTDPGQVSHVVDLLTRIGAEVTPSVEAPQQGPWHNRAVIAAGLLVVAALASIVLDWSLVAARAAPCMRLHVRHGASTGALWRKALIWGGGALVVGSVVGSAGTMTIPLTDPTTSWSTAVAMWLCCGLGSAALAMATWSLVTAGAAVMVVRDVA